MGIDPTRGFVAIPRGLTDWEWYTEPNTARLFIHLLLTSNWSQKQWQGITIHPGELVTSQPKLAKQLGLSVMQVRTALEHLKSTGCITVKAGPKYSLITLNNYDLIEAGNRQITGKQQADNNNLTINNIKTINKSSSARARETAETTMTTHPVVKEFESSIGRLSASGKAELTAYADRLGNELVSAIIAKCADLGGRSWAYVRKALVEAEAQGCCSAEEYRRTNPIGGSRAKGARVDRAEPSGNDLFSPENLQRSRERLKRMNKTKAAKEDTPDVSEQ